MIRTRVRIREGVSAGKCGTCEHARITTTLHTGAERVLCEENHPPTYVVEPLASCTDYQAKGELSKYDMEKIAWIVERQSNGKIGFVRPRKED